MMGGVHSEIVDRVFGSIQYNYIQETLRRRALSFSEIKNEMLLSSLRHIFAN